MENLENILQELYEVDPGLQNLEKDIRPLLEQMLKQKPEAALNPEFIASLRQKLLAEINLKQTEKNPAYFFKKYLPAVAGLVAVVLVGSYALFQKPQNKNTENKPVTENLVDKKNPSLDLQKENIKLAEVKKFASKEEFQKFLEDSQEAFGQGGGAEVMLAAPAPMADSNQARLSGSPASSKESASFAADRFSQTNVQVMGIDEPDIVKTDGKNLFLSINKPFVYFRSEPSPLLEENMPSESKGIMPPIRQPEASTDIVTAFPPKALKKLGKIDKQGEMLLYKNILMVFTPEGINGYNVQSLEKPENIWKIKYENNNYLSSARLKDGKLYFVTQTYAQSSNPCPIRPLSVDGKTLEIACTDIYRPSHPGSSNLVHHAFKVNSENGKVEKQLSFAGSHSNALYMSGENLYLTYAVMPDKIKIFLDFLNTSGKNYFPAHLVEKVKKLSTYDISQNAKWVEFSEIISAYQNGLTADERLKKQNDLENLMSEYLKNNKRLLEQTGIVKIPLDKFEILHTATVPGSPLNQFALDEHKNNLRIAVTVGQQNGLFLWGGWQQTETANDVYILDERLKQIGAVTDLGKTERIYSARFVGDQAYLVTFRQTDPFYVLDLKNPKKPEVKGELKIPGFSSYLHPLTPELILGIGQENGKVKLSLFDVKNPENPLEVDKYLMNEYWSEAQNNHHAFLQDEKHNIFFLPAGQNGFVFSYKNNKLNLEKAIAQNQTQRALYLEDFLYVISTEKIQVYDEKTWEKSGELELE